VGERGHPAVVLVAVDDLSGAAALREEDGGAVVVGDANGRDRPAEREARRVAGGTPSTAGCGVALAGRPANCSRTSCRNSSPSVSANHQMYSPSGEMAALYVPFVRSVTCRWVLVARSQA